MIKRITWISWTGLGLLVISIISIFVVMFSTTPEPVYKSSVNSNDLFYLPLALLSGITFVVFLKKSKSMPMGNKKPWLLFSGASFSFFSCIFLSFLFVILNIETSESFIKPLILNINLVVRFVSMILIFLGFVEEATKNDWEDKVLPMWPLYLTLVIVFVISTFIRNVWPLNEILSTFGFKLIPIGICLRVVLLAKTEPISLCYKILLFSFVADTIFAMINVPIKSNALTSIPMLLNLFCVVVATDIRTNIWLKEQS